VTLPSEYADFFDGRSAAARRVEVATNPASLRIDLPEGRQIDWRWEDLRRLPDQAQPGRMVLHEVGDAAGRLILPDGPLAQAVRTRAPALDRPPPARRRSPLLGWSAAALASVAVILLWLVPALADRLAAVLPADGEQALGEATLSQVREALNESGFDPLPLCEASDGRAALDTMTARLMQGVDLPYPLTVSILDHPMVNAFALPGGQVILMRGLIDAAGHPDEVAAVLAHEIGHVAARDPTRIALRTAGSIGVLGLLFGDFAGGTVVLFLTERMIQARYTQEAEAAADAFARQMMRDAGLPPSALAAMFRRFQARGGEPPAIVQHFLAHPTLGDRIAAAEGEPGPPGRLRPSLEDTEWQALRRICDRGPVARPASRR
jgi:beta-barrel assembly-enhancing protease